MINNSHGKRMVREDLIKGLEEAYAKTSGGTGSTINLMENIVDSKGNKRFIEGDITTSAIEGVTYTYAKWSLSGTHLMIVIAGNVENGTVIPFSDVALDIKLPQYVKDKIKVLFGAIIVTRSSITFYANDNSTQSGLSSLYKQANGNIDISISTITLTAARSFRIQFDLLIDAE